MGTAGLVIFAVGGAGVIVHLFLYEWNREASKETKWLIAIGLTASATLTLLGAALCAYIVVTQGIALPQSKLSLAMTPYTVGVISMVLLAVFFWMRRGLFNKVVALTCVYVLLVLSGVVPNPSQSDHPWPIMVLVGLISLRGLTSLGG